MATMATGSALRLTRSALFAAVCVATTGLGHALTTGRTLPGWVVACAFTAVAVLGWCLSNRDRSAAAVTGSTVVTQFALHLAFTISQLPGRDPRPELSAHAGATHSDHAPEGRSHAMEAAVLLGDHATATSGHGACAGVWLAHAAAGALCGLWMWRGDAAVLGLGRLLLLMLWAPLRRVGRLAGVAVPKPPAALHPAHTAAPAPGRVLLHHVVSRRGPPVLLLSF
ncbi:hypothetical protein DN051_13810 [Streptomyces cadmiisoli]|uniref:Integral membrane protein n=2 Tax=Streptomyces cadmiisoli TaxID=2184053 RepID=A0A2Z4IYB9_9ACTN|nr:hypothetical protein DN051_13810 [Streptomyces cadmiisoli]